MVKRSFQLRSLLILIAIVACVLAYNLSRAKQQAAFIDDVVATGGYARYYWQYKQNPKHDPNDILAGPAWLFDVNSDVWVPQWLTQSIDTNCFMRIRSVGLLTIPSDMDLSWISNSGSIESLTLYVDRDTDKLNCLKNMRKLSYLSIRSEGILDLAFVKETPALWAICIENATILDLSPLSSLQSLEGIRLENCRLSRLNVDSFKELNKLRLLEIPEFHNHEEILTQQQIAEVMEFLPDCILMQ